MDTWIDKTTWGDGPWQTEPDRVEWRDQDFVCLALRNYYGVWCGYVGLPPGHRWHGEIAFDLESIPAPGGLTFAGPCMTDDRPHREQVCHIPAPGESDDV